MNSCVNFKIFFLCKVLPTQFAGVRPLSSVNSRVIFKILISFVALPTQFAGVRLLSSVNCHMGIKVLFLFKTLPTQFAGVRLLSSVNSHLEFKVSSFCFLSRRVSKRFFPQSRNLDVCHTDFSLPSHSVLDSPLSAASGLR